jgi:hypothetical protein
LTVIPVRQSAGSSVAMICHHEMIGEHTDDEMDQALCDLQRNHAVAPG